MKAKKGDPGYIKTRKRHYLLWALAQFFVVIVLIIIGVVRNGSRLNVFTIVAIILCLPASYMLVEWITMLPCKTIDAAFLKKIQEYKHLTLLYDCVLTVEEHIMPVDVLVISDHVICGYDDAEKTDEKKVSNYLKTMLAQNGHPGFTVKIFDNPNAFLGRIADMDQKALTDSKDSERDEVRQICSLILSASM